MSDAIQAQRAPARASNEEHKDLDGKESLSSASSPHSPAYKEPVEPTFKSRGVVRIEAVARAAAASKKGQYSLWAVALLIYILQWVAAMASSMTYSLSVYATSSFSQHSSGLSALSVASSIIGSVVLPFLAKGADVFSRPLIYAVCCVLQIVGYIISLKSPTLAAYVVGNVFSAIGSSGFDFVNSLIMADLVPLKWRGLAMGLLTTPYLATVWYTSEIVAALSTDDNYGMFAIIYGVIWTPAVALMFWLENRAVKEGLINVELARSGVDDTVLADAAHPEPETTTLQKAWQIWQESDAVGLIILGFGWALLLLPFSLYGGAKGGFDNPSLIAMLTVGSVCLVVFPFYEWKVAKYPCMPKRILLNRTFLTAVGINVCYMIAAYLQLLYLSSYVYIVLDISDRNWNYFNNVQNMGLCGVAVIVGVLFKITGRYKFWQIFGLCIRIVGYGLLASKSGVHNYAQLIMSQLLSGAGSAFSSLGSQVAAQASVPHQDLSLVVALLLLWSSIGAAIGDAVAGQYWGEHMPTNLRKYIPSSVNDTEVEGFYENILAIKAYDFDSDVRQGAIRAYEVTVYPLWSAAVGVAFICLILACFQKNWYLGDAQNAYDHKDAQGHVVADDKNEHVEKRTFKQKLLRFWDL